MILDLILCLIGGAVIVALVDRISQWLGRID